MFKKFRRKQIAELREVTELDINEYSVSGRILVDSAADSTISVSISDEDKNAGSPKIGDMIGRNPKNHLDQWLVAKKYFEDNFEQI